MLEPTIYQPEFIPFYPEKKSKYNLTDKECLLYGFIRFFLKNTPEKEFYFSNKQLAKILGIKREESVSRLFNSLAKKCPEIEVDYKIKSNGGKIRVIRFGLNKNVKSDLTKMLSKKNNKKDINLSKDKLSKDKEFGNEKVNAVLKEFKEVFKREPVDVRPRQVAWNMVRNVVSVFKDIFKREPTDEEFTKVIKKIFQWFNEKDFASETYKLDTVRRYSKAVLGRLLFSYYPKEEKGENERLAVSVGSEDITPEERERISRKLDEIRKELSKKLNWSF